MNTLFSNTRPPSTFARALVILAAWLLALTSGAAAVLVVDTFDQGGFTISLDPGEQAGTAEIVNLPYGNGRLTSISTRLGLPGTVMTATLDPAATTLSYYANGSSGVARSPLDLRQTYIQDGASSILGYDAFVFEFSDVQGVGALIVELGSGSAVYPAETHRIRIKRTELPPG